MKVIPEPRRAQLSLNVFLTTRTFLYSTVPRPRVHSCILSDVMMINQDIVITHSNCWQVTNKL